MSWHRRISLLLVLVLVCGCGLFSCETPIERERRELKEASETAEVLIYRALKIGLRSASSQLNPEGPDAEATKINVLVAHILAQLDRMEGKQGDEAEPLEPLSAGEYLEIAKELYDLRETVRESDEDNYPTILHQFIVGDDAEAVRAQMDWYGSTHEHMAFALAWLVAKQVPRSFRVYETGEMDPEAIEQPGLRLGAHLIRGATFLGEGWPWLCEEEMSAYLELYTSESDELLSWTRVAQTLSAGGVEVEVADAQLMAAVHAPGALLRGLCRVQAEKEDEALDDLSAFLADAETLGIEGEAVWLVGAYVGIKREDRSLALEHLRKLEGSELLGSSERELVSEAIEAIEDREPGAALNALTDKLIVARVVTAYVIREIAKVEWRQLFEASESGQKLTRLTGVVAHEVEQVRGSLTSDQLGDLGETASQWLGKVGCGSE